MLRVQVLVRGLGVKGVGLPGRGLGLWACGLKLQGGGWTAYVGIMRALLRS